MAKDVRTNAECKKCPAKSGDKTVKDALKWGREHGQQAHGNRFLGLRFK